MAGIIPINRIGGTGVGEGGGGGALVLDSNHIFDDEQERDDYFSALPEDLFVGQTCAVLDQDPEYQYQRYDGTQWQGIGLLIQGPPGPEPDLPPDLQVYTISSVDEYGDGGYIQFDNGDQDYMDINTQLSLHLESLYDVKMLIAGEEVLRVGADFVEMDQDLVMMGNTVTDVPDAFADRDVTPFKQVKELINNALTGHGFIGFRENAIPIIVKGKLVDSGARIVRGKLKTKPNSLQIGYQIYSSGVASSFIKDEISNTYYRTLRQNEDTNEIVVHDGSSQVNEWKTTDNYAQQIEVSNGSLNTIALPSPTKDNIYIMPGNYNSGKFQVYLAAATSSELTITLELLGEPIAVIDLDQQASAGMLSLDTPPMDIDKAAELTISATQADEQPVYLRW